MNKNKLLFSLLRVTLLVLIAITAFLYAQYVILPGLAVVYSHIIGIAFGVLVIGATAYRVQKTQEKLLNEKIDATERRMKFEASLRNVEENYRKLFFESMDGVSRTTLDGKIIEANQAFCDILGCDAEKIIGEMITQFYDNPEDRLTFRGAVEKNRGVANFELVQKRVDGARIVCSISSSYFYSQNGEPEGYLTIMRDITDRKRTEQEMAILAEIGRLIGLTMNIEEVYEGCHRSPKTDPLRRNYRKPVSYSREHRHRCLCCRGGPHQR
ncbi:MAG: PAS domain S-box protein [Deltaproteobacteria bacterium]|nr:PAS domain S-box protein [Deltaproteobacteria bacterium]